MVEQNIPNDIVATFSIVGFDPDTEELGIAVQSKFLGVGAVVPWARAGVGAVATQSHANTTYGPKGLELMAAGKTAQETIDWLVKDDEDRGLRQVGIVDKHGNAATYTGDQCFDWAGGRTGKNYTAQGNILVGSETVDAMGRTFEKTEGPLAERLMKALEAAQQAGGDSRGKQSAALFVVKEKGGYSGYNDRALDLRIDDHREPIQELVRIYKLHPLYFAEPNPENIVVIDESLRAEITKELERLHYLERKSQHSDEAFNKGLTAFIHTENFEEREQSRGKVDMKVVEFMKGMEK